MNKRLKKKRRLEMKLAESLAREHLLLQAVTDQNDQLADLRRANNLQQEVIEDYGNQLAETKRELAELRAVVERNAQATNIRCDYLESKNSALSVSLDQAILEFKKPRRSFFNRK